jgi:hypothetical protein
MAFLDTLTKTLKVVGSQLTATSSQPTPSAHSTTEVYFTNNFLEKAKQWHLSEKDALDVYYHGKDRIDEPGMRCLTYHGYELCIYYGQNERTGQPYISTIWKRDRH